MCYGICRYENAQGECRYIGRFPADAACNPNPPEDTEDDAPYETWEGDIDPMTGKVMKGGSYW